MKLSALAIVLAMAAGGCAERTVIGGQTLADAGSFEQFRDDAVRSGQVQVAFNSGGTLVSDDGSTTINDVMPTGGRRCRMSRGDTAFVLAALRRATPLTEAGGAIEAAWVVRLRLRDGREATSVLPSFAPKGGNGAVIERGGQRALLAAADLVQLAHRFGALGCGVRSMEGWHWVR